MELSVIFHSITLWKNLGYFIFLIPSHLTSMGCLEAPDISCVHTLILLHIHLLLRMNNPGGKGQESQPPDGVCDFGHLGRVFALSTAPVWKHGEQVPPLL